VAARRSRFPCLLALVVIALGLGRGQAAAQRFYPDDPLLREPTPLPAPDPLRRNLSVILEAMSATFSRDGERHPGKQVIAAQGVTRLAELDAWYRDELPSAIEKRRPRHATLADGRNLFLREGETWTIGHHGAVRPLRDNKGMRYIAYLLRNPGRDVHAIQLLEGADDAAPEAPHPTATERARLSVTRAIRRALFRIAAVQPVLGRHLHTTIRTGTRCSYAPGQPPISRICLATSACCGCSARPG